MVPALVHDGRAITESTVINEYLDEVFPQVPLKPLDPYARALMRIWTKYVDEYFYPAITMLGAQFATQFASKWDEEEKKKILARMPNDEVRKKWATVTSKGYTEEELEDSRRRLRTIVRKMEQRLKETGDWLAGPYSLADIKNYSMAQHLERSDPRRLHAGDHATLLCLVAPNGGTPGGEGRARHGSPAGPGLIDLRLNRAWSSMRLRRNVSAKEPHIGLPRASRGRP